MFLLILFCGGFLLLTGLFTILDTVIWKISAGQQYILCGVRYAAMRHQFYFQELAVGMITAFFGIAVIAALLCRVKKCSCCGKYVLRKQNFCHNCGKEIKNKAS